MKQPALLGRIMALSGLLMQIAESLSLKSEPKNAIGYAKHLQDSYANKPESAVPNSEVPKHYLDHITSLLIQITALLMTLCKEINDLRQSDNRRRVDFLKEAIAHAKASQHERESPNTAR